MKKLSFILTICLVLVCFIGVMSEAKSAEPILVLEAELGNRGGNAAVYGGKVGNIGLNGGDTEGTVTFYDLDIPEDGTYTILLHYYSGSDDRTFDIRTDMGDFNVECPNTGSFDTVGTLPVDIELKKGGYITFGSYWYGPDLDKIEIYDSDAFAFKDKEYYLPDEVSFGDGDIKLILDQNNGVYSIKKGDTVILANAHAECKLGQEIIATDEFLLHTVSEENGVITFTHSGHYSFSDTMYQTFTIKDGYVLTKTYIESEEELSTNYIAPFSVYQESVNVDIGAFVQIPFDNDAWVEPKFIAAEKLAHTTKSYEVAAYYNELTGEGIVLGSVEHDLWKSGVDIYASEGEIMGLLLFNGAADSNTRDTEAHGYVSGKTISSSLAFIGCFDDWKEGMNAYGKANTDVVPAKQSSTTEVPFGYNSWGSLQGSVSYSNMVAIADYIEKYLQPTWGQDGTTVYVNIDSYWDHIVKNDPSCNMTLNEALAAFVKVCHDNGQKAGIYFTPFATWIESEETLKNTKMEGSDYYYHDALLRKADGSLYGKLDGGWALDATHPGTLARIEYQLKEFIELGFSYVKLDFLTHGALEGDHYDDTVSTGMQAYNLGLSKIHEICNGKMFVNLSIAPIFPYQYADGRRISCDAFGTLDRTQHVLSYLSACFFEKQLYTYPDPDHLVVLGSSEGVARARVTSGIISGTSFIIGDNLANVTEGSYEHEMIMKMYANKDILSVAKLGKAFLPLYVESGKRCADIYYYMEEGTLYLAIFNFDGLTDSSSLDLTALIGENEAHATELWSGEVTNLDEGSLPYSVAAEDAVVYKITAGKSEDNTQNPPAGGSDTIPEGDGSSTVPGGDGSSTVPGGENNTDNPNSENKTGNNESGSSTLTIILIVAAVAIAGAGLVFLVLRKKK